MVITVGSKYEVYVRSPAPSHMQTLDQPFRNLQIKMRGKIFYKEVFLRLSVCVVYSCDFIIVRLSNYCVVRMLHEHVYVYINIFIMWVYNNISHILNNKVCGISDLRKVGIAALSIECISIYSDKISYDFDMDLWIMWVCCCHVFVF